MRSVNGSAWPWGWVFSTVLLLPLTGCIEAIQLAPVGARQDRSLPTHIEQETRQGDPEVSLTSTDRTIDVVAAVPTLCRAVKVAPALGDQTTTRRLTAGGWVGEIALTLGAGAFGTAGGYLLGSPCAPASLGNLPCVSQVETASRTVGTGALIVAGVLATVLVATGLSTRDTRTTVATEPTRTPEPWAVCGWTPAAEARIEMWFPGAFGVGGSTDIRGSARLDLSLMPANPAFVANPYATARMAGREVGRISFGGTELHRRSVLAFGSSTEPVAHAGAR